MDVYIFYLGSYLQNKGNHQRQHDKKDTFQVKSDTLLFFE